MVKVKKTLLGAAAALVLTGTSLTATASSATAAMPNPVQPAAPLAVTASSGGGYFQIVERDP